MPNKPYIENPEDIRLNENQELQQILGNPPNWLLRWGITCILVGMVVFLALGWLVKYPDVIPTPVTLTTVEPPIKVFAEAEGKLRELLVQNNQKVRQGDTLAILNNTARLEDVGKLDAFLFNAQNATSREELLEDEIPRNLQLGTLQVAYTRFSKNFDAYIFFLKNNKTFSKIRNLRLQIEKLEELGGALTNQLNTLQDIIDVSEKELNRNKKLKDIGSVSETELESSEITYLINKRQKDALSNEIYNNELSIMQKKRTILDMKESFRSERAAGVFSIQEDIENMRSEVERWKKAYLIQAPIDGVVSLARFRSDQQFIRKGEELLTLVPSENSSIIAKGILPVQGSGKVTIGMQANLRLLGYSYQEFGSLKCEVKEISLVPIQDGFEVELTVPNPMLTTYNKNIDFQQEMKGTANIVTEDRRILERVFDRVLSIVFND